jgi:ribosomal protein S18 acetylase RimI-like enzyme
MVKDDLKIEAIEVTTEAHAEMVRQVRNECRAYMTRDTDSIGPEKQRAWFHDLDKKANRLFVFYVTGVDSCCGACWSTAGGYGLCRLIAGKWWVSGGLSSEFQGKGLGKALFGHLLSVTGTPCWLEVLEHNTRAMNTYKRLGFVEKSREAGIVTMVKSS